MRHFVFFLDPHDGTPLQTQLRRQMVAAILNRQLPAGEAVPSSRGLSKQLGISRATVVLAYQGLVDEGYLVSRARSGLYVNPDFVAPAAAADDPHLPTPEQMDWRARFARHLSSQRNISKPVDWQRYPYPFVYGQIDPTLFPLAEWRDCSRLALSRLALSDWVGDLVKADDPLLVEQLRTRVLPRRGIQAGADEILITAGAQNALWLLSSLLLDESKRVGVEDPGYVDARNIFSLRTGAVRPLKIDRDGLVVDRQLDGIDYLYVTPSHQSPTTVTLPLARRLALLERAAEIGMAIIEDDYEAEANYLGRTMPALKSLDRSGQVIYIGSLSKSIAPGLRLGYLIGPKALVQEARELRRLVLRHPPANNQRCVALFLANGHFDALLHRLSLVYRERWAAMNEALERHLPGWSRAPTFGGTSFWIEGPPGFDAGALAEAALEQGVVIEPGAVHFMALDPPRNCFRLGFAAMDKERCEAGVRRLARLIHGH